MALLLWAGRGVRYYLLMGKDQRWRDPLLLDQLLPPLETTTRPPPAVLDHPLDINRCPADSLLLLSGVGPVLAARIVAERTAGGPFADPQDLQRVKGIGPHLSRRLAPLLTFAAERPDTLRTPPSSAASSSQLHPRDQLHKNSLKGRAKPSIR
jgi:hypothetical protein